MTTIATDGKSMAGDGQAEACNTIIAFTRAKVVRLADGSLFGMAGRGADSVAMVKWLNEGGRRPKCQSMSALRLYPNGTLKYLSDGTDEATLVDSPCAVGSGMDFAIGAMLHGATPQEAVAIAAQRDPGTGGKITVLHLEPKIRAAA